MEIFVLILLGVIVLCLALYLFMIAPRLKKRKFKLPEVGYAHRGLWDEKRPENSMSAFSAAVERGYGIETDVRLTKDGEAVLFHDDTLERVCGDSRKVIDCTYDELMQLTLSGSEERVPRLEELLSLAGGRVPLLIELKGEDLRGELCDKIAPMLDGYGDMLVVESFNPLLLRRMKKLRPEMPRGQLVTNLPAQKYPGNKIRNCLLSWLMLNFLSKPDFIAYDGRFPNAVSVNICIKLFGARAMIWTPRGKAELEKAQKTGACPIFESPDE